MLPGYIALIIIIDSCMNIPKPAAAVFSGLFLITVLFTSCYKDEIKFGEIRGESYTRIITIDTITPVMSTYVLDSFPTSGNNIILVGRWADPLMGPTKASSFFQLGLPAGITDLSFPNDAVFDSLAFTLRPNKQYYGDTLQAQTFSLYELAYQPDYTYANRLYNTSSTTRLPTPLGSVTQTFRPSRPDSLQIRLSQSKGLELYNKIKAKAQEVSTADNFLNYMRGFSIEVGNNDKGAIFGFNTADSSIVMKLHYHTTIPDYQEHEILFTLTRTEYQYNQVLTDRTNTPLQPQFAGQQEFFTSKAVPYAFTQAGTGTLMKVKFPTLRSLLGLGSVVKLLSAKLVIKPVERVFDEYGYRLPDTLFLAQTDATNIIGNAISNASGGTAYSAPYIDYIDRQNTSYSFDVSAYVNYLMNTPGVTEDGVFVLEEYPGSAKKLNRGVMGSWEHAKYKTQLELTVMLIE